MRKDFIDKHYDVAKGWMKADLEGLKYIIDHPDEVAKMVAEELPGWTPAMVRTALDGRFPGPRRRERRERGARRPFDKQMMTYFSEAYRFWHSVKAVPSPDIRKAHLYEALEEAAAELGMKLPVGVIKGTGAQKGTAK
jgi:ABC-type nitrate/sulfonate/bicarbonate transport system substrate-binding protein